MKSYLFYIFFILFTVGLNTIALRLLKQRWNLWLGCGIPALCMMLFMWKASEPNPAFLDFTTAYYPASKLIIENPSELYNKLGADGFVNIPIIAFLFTPFSLFNEPTAQIIMTVLGILALLATYYSLVKLTNIHGWKKIALFGVFVINGPLYYSLKEGNTTHFVLLLLLAAVFCLQGRQIWAGVFLAITALIKLPLLIFGFYLAARMRWQALLGFITTLVVIVGSSLLLFGVDLHLTWFYECIQPYTSKPISLYNVQSVDGFLIRLLTSPNLLNTMVPIEVDWSFKLMRYLLLALLIGGSIWICWRSKTPTTSEVQNLEFCIVLCLALITSPISWTHYYLLLLLPLSLYLCDRLAVPQDRSIVNLMVLATVLISLPVKRVDAVIVLRFFISHYFFGGILLLGVLLAARWHTSRHPQLSQSSISELV